jgi:hypothetical protein
MEGTEPESVHIFLWDFAMLEGFINYWSKALREVTHNRYFSRLLLIAIISINSFIGQVCSASLAAMSLAFLPRDPSNYSGQHFIWTV